MNKIEIEYLNTVLDITEEDKYHVTNCIRLEYLECKLDPTYFGGLRFA
jgi:hypothetical protein